MKQVSIVGGGLAGLALGVSLRAKGVPTTLYEAGRYPKHKVCGEFICGVEESLLREHGAEMVIEHSQHHRMMTWAMGDQTVIQEPLPTVAWGLSRHSLDLQLSEKFTALGGDLRLGKRVDIKALSPEGFVSGVGKRKQGNAHAWIGLKIHALPPEVIHGLEMHTGRHGYIGLCEVEGGRVNCCGLFKVDKSLKGKGLSLMLAYLRESGLSSLATRMERWDVDPASFSATSGFEFGTQEWGHDFRIGDAAYLIPPFTGNGMSMALESAYHASGFLAQYSMGEIPWSECHRLYKDAVNAHFRKRMWVAMSLHPLLFNKTTATVLKTLARSSLLPFNTLFTSLRTP